MPKHKLTDVGLRSLPTPDTGQITYWDAAFKGGSFGCRISQGGTRTFVIKHQNRRYTLGQFPILTLAKAREEARTLLAELTLGKSRPVSITYQHAVDLFLEEKGKNRRPRTLYDYKRLLGRLGFKGQLADLTPTELQRRMKRFTAPAEYNHLLVALKVFCSWAIKRRHIEHNPTLGLSQHQSKPRSRVLTDHELYLIWRACEQNDTRRVAERSKAPVSELIADRMGRLVDKPTTSDSSNLSAPRIALPAHFATIVKLLILTGQRKGEIAALRAEYFNEHSGTDTRHLGASESGLRGLRTSSQEMHLRSDNSSKRLLLTCTLPASLTKNKREHSFPLGSLSAKLVAPLLELSSGATASQLIFPARGQPTKPFNGWSKAKAALDKLSGVTDWTLHDLRRTFASGLARLGTPIHVVEKLLNHVSGTHGGIVGVYQRHQYFDEQVEAIAKWDAHICAITATN